MARAKARAPRPPRGLVVEQVECDGEELLVFSWADASDGSGDHPAIAPATLSAAEHDVLARVVRGDSNAEIARARKTSIRTVANQVASLLRKTGAASRFELIKRYAGGKRA